MTIAELIKLLSEFPSNTLVFAWRDGERYQIDCLDYFMEEEFPFLDINLDDRLPEDAS